MNYQVTRTKIILPRRRSDLLSRPRLLELLDELLEFRLVILIAPAGYGKTFLLVDFAHYIEQPVCWYALDALDRDAYRFCNHFIASVQQQFPTFGNASFAALQSMAVGQGTLEQLVATVVNDLYEHVQKDFVLVLDDFYLVDENPEINLFISQFIQQVDEQCHLIIASRRLLSLPDMALMVGRGYVGGLDFEDLAFEAGELQNLSAKNYSQEISTPDAKMLIEATDGWIIGLLLSTQSKLRNISGRMRLMRASGIDLYDYLAEQVLNQQPLEIQEFLLRTSLLEEFDATLCATVFTGYWSPTAGSWQALIDEVLRRNLFVLPLGDDAAWLRYNYVFQEFLQRRIARQRPDEERIILERLAELYQTRKEWEKAHYVLRRLGNPQSVIALIERAGITLLNAGRIPLLATWLAELSQESTVAYPILLTLHGFVKARQGEVKEGLLLLDRAIAAEWPVDNRKYLAYALTRRSIVHRFLGNYQLSLEDVESAFALIDQMDPQNEEVMTITAQSQHAKGFTFFQMGKPEAGTFWLEKALHTYQTLNLPHHLALTYLDLATVYLNTGRYQEALPLFQDISRVWGKLNNLAEQANVFNNLGYLHHLLGHYEEALELLGKAHDYAQRSGYIRIIGYALSSIGDVCTDLGTLDAARKLYIAARTVARSINEHYLLVYIELALAKLAAMQADWSSVFTALDAAGKLVIDRHSSSEWGLYQFTVGYCHLLQNKAKEVMASLSDAVVHFAGGGQPLEEAGTHFLLAFAYTMAKQAAPAQQHLVRALDLAFALESRYALLTSLRAIQPYLQDKKTQALDERVRTLLVEFLKIEEQIPLVNRRLRQTAPPLLADLLSRTPQFIIRTLGRAEVSVQGQPLTNSDWQTLVSRDLFLCLLAHPNGLTKEEIGLLFWPDAAPAELKTRFKNAIYRLRSAFKQEVILFENDIYTFNRTLDYEYDVDAFELHIANGNRISSPKERIEAYQAALALYRGPYLPDVDANWIWAERERISRLFVDRALILAQLQLEQKQYNATLETTQRILEEDSCQEDAHRLAMRTYAALGNRAAIARQYAQCEQALLTEIDAPPSPQTAELYRSLMG